MTLNRVNSALAGLCIFTLATSCAALVIQTERGQTTREVVQVTEVNLSTQNQRVNLFIDELLSKKSARCFKAILQAESHFDSNAKNPYSTARGMGQLLESTYRNIGLRHSADPLAQVVASLAYISRHYGSGGTCAAWKSEKYTHSY